MGFQPSMEMKHDYPDRSVQLHVHTMRDFSGEVHALEGQALEWVSVGVGSVGVGSVGELRELDFLQGNQAMIEKLELERMQQNNK